MTAIDARPRETAWQLRRCVPFDHSNDDEIEGIARNLRVREFKRREPVYLPSDRSACVHVLLKGRVKITRTDSLTGKELILYIVHRGEVFGLNLRDAAPRIATSAITMQKSLVALIPRRDFDRLLSNHAFSVELNQVVGEQLARVAIRLDELAFRDVPSRLARILLRLAEEFPREFAGLPAIDVALTQQDLADLLGVTRESTNIAMNDLKRRGVIDFRRHIIMIRDRARLQEIGA
jgi:CRP/FNR family transcriptional regulator, cyclic AMP receptor protein